MSGFANPIVGGGGGLVYPSVHSPNFNVANPMASPSPSWAILKNGLAYFFGLVITGGTIVGPNYVISPAGFFFYSGAPALGNLTGSIAALGGADLFGNPYRPGTWIYGPTNGSAAGLEVNAGDAGVVLAPPNSTSLTSDPQLIGSNANSGAANETEWALISSGIASGGQQAEIAAISEAADGSSPASVWLVFNGVTPALIATQSQITYGGAIALQQLATPANVIGYGLLYSNSNGNPAGETSAGVAGTFPLSQADIGTHAVGNTGTAGNITKAWPVPAGDGSPGTVYTVKALASLSIGQTTAETLTIGASIGGTLIPLATLGAAFNGSTLSAQYDIPLELVVMVDAGGANIPQIYLNGPLGITSANRLATSSANMSGHNNGSSWVKANPNTLAIYAIWGGAGGSQQNIQTIASRLYREGP